LIPTLHSLLAVADAHFDAGRIAKANLAFEELLGRAQDKVDRPAEVIARSMIARCLMLRRDVEEARVHARWASQVLDPNHLQSHARYRGTLARLAIQELTGDALHRELRAYLDWAQKSQMPEAEVDACLMLAERADVDGRLHWLEHALEIGRTSGYEEPLGRVCNDLAAALDQSERPDEALEMYEQSRTWHVRHGTSRDIVGACWAIGAVAIRTEDWPLARQRLEEGLLASEKATSTQDLKALILMELARVHAAAGDVIEARRLMIRAIAIAREEDLEQHWPHYWSGMCEFSQQLDLEV